MTDQPQAEVDPELDPEMEISVDYAKLFDGLKHLGLDLDTESPQNFIQGMTDYLTATGKMTIKPEPGATASSASQSTLLTEALSNITQPPRLSIFLGEEGKGEATYEVWRYEVDSLLNKAKYPQHVLVQAIRRSLKGDAAKVASFSGADADAATILSKLDSVYGICEEPESLKANFYSAKQRSAESVVAWTCRVEELYARITRDNKPSAIETD